MKLVVDKRALRLPCERVNKAKGIELGRDLIKFAMNFNETHKDQQAIGLAAPQVGVYKQVCIVRINGRFLMFVNPVIVERSEATVEWKERCISLPGIEVNTSRNIWTTVRADNFNDEVHYGLHDSNLSTTRQAYDILLENVAIQHEVDHLAGVLITDRDIKQCQNN
jgi:peptide deformylase